MSSLNYFSTSHIPVHAAPLTASAHAHAITHCRTIMASAHRPPSSRLTAAIAATHGVYRRQNTRSDAADAGDSASVSSSPGPNSTVKVDTTLSFAMKPVISAVEIRQSPKPSGMNTGVMIFAAAASMLSFESPTMLKCTSNVCKNQMMMAARKITVNARCKKSFAFSHKSCATFFMPGSL